MNDFTASNGIHIVSTNAGATAYIDGSECYLGFAEHAAYEEYFRAREDERRGRWRWPENPDVLVYPEVDGLHWVVREDTGEAQPRNGLYLNDPFGTAASDYRDAHPEPKPWRDAQCGESWALVYLNEEVPAVASSSESGHIIFTASTNQGGCTEEFRTDSKHITAGRRIWPEPEA